MGETSSTLVDDNIESVKYIRTYINDDFGRFSEDDPVERTYMHELGHGIGLAHPHDPGYDYIYLNSVFSIMNQSTYTHKTNHITFDDEFNLKDVH